MIALVRDAFILVAVADRVPASAGP